MSNLTESHLLAFNDELEKTALGVPGTLLHRFVGGAGAGAGIGGAIGAIGGGLHSGVQGYREAKEQGQNTGQALLHGGLNSLGGAGKGALIGAAAGGTLGGVGAAAAGHTAYNSAMQHIGDSFLGGAAHGGQRVVHGVTGWTPEKGIASIGGGSADAASRLQYAQKAHAALPHGPHPDPKMYKQQDKVLGELAGATKGHEAALTAERMGLTSIPGWLRSARDNGLAKTIGTDLADSWHSGGAFHKTLTMGLPVTFGAYELSQASKPTEPGGPGKAERYGRAIGQIAGGLTGGSMPLVGNILWGEGLSQGGKYVGRAIDKGKALHGRLTTPPPYPENGQHVPVERVQSPSSLGMPNEGAQ